MEEKLTQGKVDKMLDAQAVIDDQARSHAVFFVDCATTDEIQVETEIENGLLGLQDRATKAGMEMVGPPAILHDTYYDANDRAGHLCITVICAWMSRANLDKIRLQQQLSGGQVDPRLTKGTR